jgi:hypothetical protein
MAKKSPDSELETLFCNLCHREIPHAEELSIEGQEYAYHFCGHDCYDHWRQDEQGKDRRKEGRRGADTP